MSAAGGDGPKRGDDVVHRGVRWQRASSGAMRWWDEEQGTWVRYRRGSDAPPRPPGWERTRTGLHMPVSRPSWRSPYRIVPLVMLAAVIGLGLWQALGGSGGQTAAEAKAAAALKGKCLAQKGFAGGHPEYSSTAVACGSPGAVVKVVEVLPGNPGSPSCPAATTPVVIAYPGVRYPHQLCVAPSGG